MDLEEYSYIWDGSDPGWEIIRSYNNCYEIVLMFAPTGASKNEKLSILQISLNFESITELHKALKGKAEYVLGEFDSTSIKKVEALCQAACLKYQINDKSSVISILQNKDHVLLIEDESLNEKLTVYAESKGIPVIEQTD